jgi:chromosome segregation and condensation protein ScpB
MSKRQMWELAYGQACKKNSTEYKRPKQLQDLINRGLLHFKERRPGRPATYVVGPFWTDDE